MQKPTPDYLLIRKKYTGALTFESAPIMQRGLAEFRPRRISSVKLGATLIRQQQHTVSTALNRATILMPLLATEAQDLDRHLIDIPNLQLGPATLTSFFDSLVDVDGSQIVAVISDVDKPRVESHTQFARSIRSQNPLFERQFAKTMVDSLSTVMGELVPQGADRRRLVIEDRGGRANLLSLGDQSLKLNIKRWQMLLGKENEAQGRTPLEISEGWGITSIRMRSHLEDNARCPPRTARFALLSIRLTEDQINLDTGKVLRTIAENWIGPDQGFDWCSLARLVISDPWPIIARQLATAFTTSKAQSPLTQYPDLVHGWQPVLTAAEFCINPDLPALLISTGTFPNVHMMAAWI